MLKTILTRALVALFIFAQSLLAEETSIIVALSPSTLSGYIDTSAYWQVGPIRWNDSVTNATVCEGATGSVAVSSELTNATLEAGEPSSPHQTGSLWYLWSVSRLGIARISMTNLFVFPTPAAVSFAPALSPQSIFYPGGGITTGSESGFEEWRAVVRPGYQRWSALLAAYRLVRTPDGTEKLELVQRGVDLEFEVQARNYWIAVDVYENLPTYPGQSESPSILPTALYFDITPPPINNAFGSNLSVGDSAGGMLTGYLLASTRETNEPVLAAGYSGGSAWFHYTAATYGAVTIGSATNTVPIAVFTGSDLSNLSLVAKSASGPVTFFGEEKRLYHIAVYSGPQNVRAFSFPFTAPQYRLYETTLSDLMLNGLLPHFYGVRGVTMLSYARTANGWECVEIEPIVNQTADLLIRPGNAVDGQLRVIAIDETLPAPHVQLRLARGVLIPDVIGYAGQTCAISYSIDLINWSTPEVHTLTSTPLSLAAISPSAPTHFFRVTQSLPQPTSPQVTIADPLAAPAHPVGLVHTATLSNSSGPGEPLPLTPLVLVSIPGQP